MLKNIKRSRGMLVKNDVKYVEEDKTGSTAKKQEAKSKLTVTVNGVEFNADALSISYMSAAVTSAHKHMLDAMAADSSLTIADAHDQVYSSTIQWKGADNIVHNVQVKTLATALEEALGAIGNIVGA